MCHCNNEMGGHKGVCTPAYDCRVLLIIGGINWGLVGAGMLSWW